MKKTYYTDIISEQELAELNGKLSVVGLSFSRIRSEGTESLKIELDEEVYDRAIRRNAGRPYSILKENGYLAHVTKGEIKERMKTRNASEIASDLGISRRTLFRRLNEAESDDEELL